MGLRNPNKQTNKHCKYLGPFQECRSIRSAASGLPYYYTPPVTVPDVIGVIAVSHSCGGKTQKQKQKL
jgi:hypothetical protein